MIKIDEEKFKKVKTEAKAYYQSIGKVYCPYLRRQVSFNAKGFEHLLGKSWNQIRSQTDQYSRLRLIPVAKEIIALSHTLQEFESRISSSRRKIGDKWVSVKLSINYYVFIAISKDRNSRIKVVVKEYEGGEIFFYSLYPFWKTIRNIDGINKIFYSEDLEEC